MFIKVKAATEIDKEYCLRIATSFEFKDGYYRSFIVNDDYWSEEAIKLIESNYSTLIFNIEEKIVTGSHNDTTPIPYKCMEARSPQELMMLLRMFQEGKYQ